MVTRNYVSDPVCPTSGRLDRSRIACLEVADQVVEGVAAVEDVLDDQHMPVFHILSGVHEKTDIAAVISMVGRECDEIDDMVD